MAGRLVFTTVLLLIAFICVQSRSLKWRPLQQQIGSSSEEEGPARQQDGSDESDDSDSSEEQMAADPATTRPNVPMGTTSSPGLPMGTTLPPAPLNTNQPDHSGATDYVTEIDSTATVTCIMRCPLELDIVCGTDGVNYQSECVLRAEACRRGDTDLDVAYAGPCIAATATAP